MSYKDSLYKEVLEKVSEFVNMLRDSKIEPKCVILFGSYARGDFTENSDIDVCVISEDLPAEELGRRSLTARLGVAKVNAIGYYPDEFISMMRKLNPIVLDVVYEGLPIIDDGFFEECKEEFRKLSERFNLRRDRKGWMWSTCKQND